MRVFFCCVSVCLAVLFSTSHLGAREFTSSSGQKIDASIVSVVGDDVMLRRSDGKTFTVPVSRFSSADIDYIKKWQEENKGKVPEHLRDKLPRLDMVVTNAARSSKDGDNQSGFVNEKMKKLQLKAVIENEDAVYPIPSANITFMIWGESPETGSDVVVYHQEFKDFELPYNITKTYETPLVEVWWDDIGAMYGHEYKGFFVIITDSEGKVLGARTQPSSATKNVDSIIELKAGDVFDRSYRKTGTENVSRTVKKARS